MIIGTAVGFETTAATAISIGTALVASFLLGSNADLAGVDPVTSGIFGTAVATMGMLMSAAYILAMDTFGPDHGQRRWHHGVLRRSCERP